MTDSEEGSDALDEVSYYFGEFPKSSKLLDALTSISYNPNYDDWVHYNVITPLIKLNHIDEIIDDLVNKLTKPDPREGYKLSYVYNLQVINDLDTKIIDALLHLINETSDDDLYYEATKTLGNSNKGDNKVTDFLVSIISDPTNENKGGAVEALRILGKLDSQMIDLLIQLVTNRLTDFNPRADIVRCLGILDKSDTRIIDLLTFLANDSNEDFFVRIYAVESLINLGKNDEKNINLLTELLNLERNYFFKNPLSTAYFTRLDIVKTLGKLGEFDDKWIDILVSVIRKSGADDSYRKDWQLCGEVAKILGDIGKPNNNVIETLLAMVNGPNARLDSDGCEALAKICSKNKLDDTRTFQIIKLIFQRLNEEKCFPTFTNLSLFQLWQTYRSYNNNLIFTWDMLKMSEKELAERFIPNS